MTNDEQLLTPEQTADLLGVDVEELAAMRARGVGPEWGELVRRHIRYSRRDVEAHLARATDHQDPAVRRNHEEQS